jgi:hypothetical protein
MGDPYNQTNDTRKAFPYLSRWRYLMARSHEISTRFRVVGSVQTKTSRVSSSLL